MARKPAMLLGLALVAASAAAQQTPEPVQPPPHTSPWPMLGTGATQGMVEASYALGPELQRGQSARDLLADRRRLDRALAALLPQRKGVVDAYVVSVALDSDPVFSREAREAGKVLARRYDAAGRAITLAGPDGHVAGLPKGALGSLTIVLARVAELMDPNEDVLVLYTTSHGAPEGVAFHDGDTGFGVLSPYRLASVLAELRIKRRIVLISACYSGVFVPFLATPDTALVTAASSDRTSFGCMADNDWTFFGDALVNHALRKPAPLAAAAAEARQTIAGWETDYGLPPSQPQVAIGAAVARWLPAVEARTPKTETPPTGQAAVAALAPTGLTRVAGGQGR
jgi:hypothetical protein